MIELHPKDLVLMLPMLGVSGDGLVETVRLAIDLARTRLVTLAQQRLRSSARDYVAAISPAVVSVSGGRVQAKITLRGAFPNMVEHGAAPWDLRDSILKPGTRKLKKSKAGHYFLHVPFRHMGPTANGKNAAAMGSAYGPASTAPHRAFRGGLDAAQAAKMGRAVHRAAKRLAATRSAPAVSVGPGMTMKAPTSYGGRLEQGTGGAGILRPRHVVDVYAGMIREEKTYEKATQQQFMTFRTISMNPKTRRHDEAGGSSEVNWTHPGIEARRLIPLTVSYLDDLIAKGAFGG